MTDQPSNSGKKQKVKNNLKTTSKADYVRGKGFDANPQNINRDGRPRKLWTTITAELKEKGYPPLTETQIVDAFTTLLQLPKEEVTQLLESDNIPEAYQIVIKYLRSNRGMEMMDRIMDRSFGKVMQRQMIDATVTAKPIPESQEKTRDELVKEVRAMLDPSDIAIIEQSDMKKDD